MALNRLPIMLYRRSGKLTAQARKGPAQIIHRKPVMSHLKILQRYPTLC
jgi:hypothetical protein